MMGKHDGMGRSSAVELSGAVDSFLFLPVVKEIGGAWGFNQV